MDHPRTSTAWIVLAAGAAAVVTLAVALLVSSALAAALAAGVTTLVVLIAAQRTATGGDVPVPGRRRFLAGAGTLGLIAAAGGAAIGTAVRRAAVPTPSESVEDMASGLGAEYMELARRGYYPGRSGELQLVVLPYNSANYAPESRSLVPRDPRTSHAAPWLYLNRIPLLVHAPGHVAPGTYGDRVSLADVAPTTAALLGSTFETADGAVLPGITRVSRPPRIVVTFVIDGGGLNALRQFPDRWPVLRRLMATSANYPNAIMGSNPAVTACAHATIGTGAFPSSHGISGHFLRFPDGRVAKAYGEDGEADTSVILTPTLAEWWAEETNGAAWIGEIGYQIWHVGMIGRPRGYRGEKPVAVYFDEDHDTRWESQNSAFYRLPRRVPPREVLSGYLQSYTFPAELSEFDPTGGKYQCCSPPIIRYQGDLIEATFDAEPVGRTPATSLLFINYKAPDYAGHVYNMLSGQEAIALEAVDAELGRLVQLLETRFPGEYALIVTADHGQCPLPVDVGGVRLDPIQLQADLENAFGRPHGVRLVQDVRPAEIYLEPAALEALRTVDDTRIAAAFRDYTYGDNYAVYTEEFKLGDRIYRGVPRDAIQWHLLGRNEFAAVLPASFLQGLGTGPLARYGSGIYGYADTTGPVKVSLPPGSSGGEPVTSS